MDLRPISHVVVDSATMRRISIKALCVIFGVYSLMGRGGAPFLPV